LQFISINFCLSVGFSGLSKYILRFFASLLGELVGLPPNCVNQLRESLGNAGLSDLGPAKPD